jgi:hypothetical protein
LGGSVRLKRLLRLLGGSVRLKRLKPPNCCENGAFSHRDRDCWSIWRKRWLGCRDWTVLLNAPRGWRPGASSAVPLRQAPTASRGRQGRLCGTGLKIVIPAHALKSSISPYLSPPKRSGLQALRHILRRPDSSTLSLQGSRDERESLVYLSLERAHLPIYIRSCRGRDIPPLLPVQIRGLNASGSPLRPPSSRRFPATLSFGIRNCCVL